MSILLRDTGKNPGRDSIKADQITILRDTQGVFGLAVTDIPFQDAILKFHRFSLNPDQTFVNQGIVSLYRPY
jgi:hypothetical protein